MLILYAVAIFLSAGLLFLVQPMVAKLVLPLLGGTPAVWTTCMLFFQAMLLGGYLYAHVLDRRLAPRTQVYVHLVVCLVAAGFLPVGLPAFATNAGMAGALDSQMALWFWLIAVLAATVGGPFFVISTTGPLLQRWFSRTGHPHASDPYFLYAASNAGSLLGLAAYPLLLEPFLGVRAQGVAWSAGFGVFLVLVIGCGAAMMRPASTPARGPGPRPGQGIVRAAGRGSRASAKRPPSHAPVAAEHGTTVVPPSNASPSRLRVLKWLALAAAPSSLMLGVTQQVTTDIAAFPLLWIIPLGLYLLSYIVAFSPRIKVPVRALGHVVAVLACGVVAVEILLIRSPLWSVIGLHVLAFFASATLCHRLLADDRPSAEHLTSYYLVMASGGAVGGLFNSLVAPMAFDDVYEYSIALVAVVLLRPPSGDRGAANEPARDVPSIALRRSILPLAMLAVMVCVGVFLEKPQWHERIGVDRVYAAEPWLRAALPLAIAGWAMARPLQFGACFAVFAASAYFVRPAGATTEVYRERSFFGVLRVTDQFAGTWRTLLHGTTTHGIQIFSGDEARRRPTSYFHPTGPVGQFFAALGESDLRTRVAVVGLGAGSIAMYSRPGDEFVFYEIDRAVLDIATGHGLDKQYFTFVHEAAGEVEIRLADGRLGLAGDPDGHYGVIILDAFSSDAIPVHLLTQEAFEMYLRKLRPGGLLLVHISNRYFELAPVVARIAHEMGCASLLNMDSKPWPELAAEGKQQSKWMVIGREGRTLSLLRTEPTLWRDVAPGKKAPLWTDDWTNVLGVLDLK